MNLVTACPQCGAAFVWHTGTAETMVGFSSPEGHDHDDNCHSRTYSCMNGHTTKLSLRRYCPTWGCDWVGKETCFCHQGSKVDAWPKGVPWIGDNKEATG